MCFPPKETKKKTKKDLYGKCLYAVVSGLQRVESGMGNPDRRVLIFHILWLYCTGHAGVKGNDRHPSSHTPVAVLHWTCGSEGK